MRDLLSRNSVVAFLAVSCVLCVNASVFAQDKSDTSQEANAASADAGNATDAEAAAAVLQTAKFLGVTPGETTLDDVVDKLGTPLEKHATKSELVLQYAIGPFPSVEITLHDEIVVAVVAELAEARQAAGLAKELGLDSFVPILVENNGEALGLAYPERGMLFSYAPGAPRPVVDRIVLEPLSADLFLLRADATPSDQYLRKLEDLERVLDLAPNNAEALWQGAKLLDTTGKHADALQLAKSAVKSSRNSLQYQLTLARFTASAGDHQDAVTSVKRLLARSNLASIDEAEAKLLLGDLLSSGLNRDFEAAIAQHLAAVKIATPLVSDSDSAIRHRAELVLVEAYLSAANDIARGNWDSKSEVVPKWLHSAEELATGFVQNDGADAILPLRVWRRTLEAYAGMDGDVTDTASIIEAAQQTAAALLETSDDSLYTQHVQWELLQSHFSALRISQTRARWSEALTYADEAVRLAEQLPKDRTTTAPGRYLIGRLYFYVGSIYAIHYKDHTEAVRWFERSLPNLEGSLHKSNLVDTGIHGERFVSMGVSYWEVESPEEAIKLTERGRELMERATKAGLLGQQALVVPYTNLAEMLRADGRDTEAESFASKVARLEAGRTQR